MDQTQIGNFKIYINYINLINKNKTYALEEI